MTKNSTSFKKGDPRAAAGGKKGKRGPALHVEPSIWDEIKRLGPKALAAIEERLDVDQDMTAARMVLDRVASTDLIKDAEMKEVVSALQATIADLTSEVERLRTENARVTSERDLLHEAVSQTTKPSGKRTPNPRAN
ncbi:hypothetical protein [Ruegeria lacuscaerulensis]|uniref:hypothetical protein n=1 Tax=Ruegeria lacuscaerulensis TaxID=55218 RepID=UPI00147DAD4F|nr:hypothetical protein [Ruegeria lacuscaerulensis]